MGSNRNVLLPFEDFIKKKDHKFKDFMQLKVGGIDRFSRLKEEDLEDMILSEMKETIEKGIHDPSSYNNVLKWMLRYIRSM